MHLLVSLQSLHVGFWVYVILFIGMLLEGTLFLLTAAFLIAQGVFNPLLAVAALVLGSFSEEVMWWWIGGHLSRWQWLAVRVDKLARRFDQFILSKTFRTFNFSKYIYGLHRPIITRAGMLNMPFAKFIKAAWTSTAIWLLVIGALGFIFSASFDVVKKYVSYAELIPLLALVVFYGLERFISQRLKKDL